MKSTKPFAQPRIAPWTLWPTTRFVATLLTDDCIAAGSPSSESLCIRGCSISNPGSAASGSDRSPFHFFALMR